MPDDCPVCQAKALGAAMMRDCNLGKMSPYDVARQLNCSYEQVMEHTNASHEIQIDANGKMQSEDQLLARLAENMNTLDEWSHYVISTVKKPSDVDNAKVKMLVSLTQEIRKTVEAIGTLQGRIGPGDALIQLKVTNAKFMLLTNEIAARCCPDCQMKVLNILEMPELGGGSCRTLLPSASSSQERALMEKTI